ncbi:metallo-beta-lactamase [Ectothiorhodospira haloalkaliphila]|uniref:Metallo-beta-lactamase n=1 Tax=Ectothiorhodospira haloalkaliphila TaxID=421628 RepID=W8KVA6_9GAMM|nr:MULTISPECIES: MBL fold metallo-hydrolase [Ectothiorhodospira]AHK79516.1 metallo-beta-lactamase [Ectothiorhodospira haloalkaliphila]MCG5498282.1 MBL fold metallo-hydrolase [Ectothiorhodospira variabilis]
MTASPTHVVHTLQLGPMDNFIYLLEDKASRQAAIVDPAWEVDEALERARSLGLDITHILLTHTHQDHINGLDEVRAQTGAEVHLLQAEADYWGQAPTDAVLHNDGDEIRLGDTLIRVLHTPGHTPGGTCYHLGDDLITGDTLFVYGCGRCDLKQGDPKAMLRSLKRLRDELPGRTVIHPGHDYGVQPTSTLAEQAQGNPFMHFEDEAAFVHYRMEEHDRVRSGPYGPEKAPVGAQGSQS